MNEKYAISKAAICPLGFEGKTVMPRVSEFPQKRLCVIDMEKNIAIDVEHELKYFYLKTINGKYLMQDQVINALPEERVALFPELLFLDDLNELKKVRRILKKLEQGYEFADGNEILNNEEYKELLEVNKLNHKQKKMIRRKR